MKACPKPIALCIAALTLFSILVPAIAQGTQENVLLNGGFESGIFEDWNSPVDGPNEIPDRGTWEVTGEEAHSGSYSAVNRAVNLHRANYFAVLWQQSDQVTPGTEYTFSAWVKPFLNESSDAIAAGIAIDSWGRFGWGPLAEAVVHNSANGNWTYLSTTVVPSTETLRFRFFVSDNWSGSGAVANSRVYFDDAAVTFAAVPEPGSLLLMVLGLLWVVPLMKRRA